VVEADPKFTVNSLDSTSLKAGGNQNKLWNLLNPNWEKFGKKNGITCILEVVPNIQ
jgi:hypothetical protein